MQVCQALLNLSQVLSWAPSTHLKSASAREEKKEERKKERTKKREC